MTYINPNDAMVEAMARAIYNDGRGPRVTPFDQLAKGAKHYWYDRARAAAAVIADALAERDARIRVLEEVLKFDCTEFPGMEEAAIKWSMHIANDRGKKPRLPDPIAILEMCEDVARAALGSAKV